MNIGGRQISRINLATGLLFAGTFCVICVVGALLVRPGPAPGFGLPNKTTPLLTASTTAIPLVFPTFAATWTPAPTGTPPPTRTPLPTDAAPGEAQTTLPDLNATAAASQDAKVKANVDTLRVRALPGTAGAVLGTLAALAPVHIIGRTTDNVWLQISTPEGVAGWVLAEFLDISINLVGVPVTAAGAALDATATLPPGTDAKIKPEGDHLRLRQGPGTAGAILANLPAGMVLHLVGRTSDNVWLQVITDDRQQGWVMAQYLDIFIDLGVLPVTGAAQNAPPPTATRSSPAGDGSGTTQIAFVPTATPTNTEPPTPTNTPPPPTEPPPSPTSPPPPGYDHPSDYITGITDHTRQIYLAGQSSGNRANVFSKVGDSITVAPQFLYPLAAADQVNLEGYGYLGEVLDRFGQQWVRTGNSFANNSLAAKGGWSSWSVLSPSAANHALCLANESPLRCEYRVSRPAIALILLGTNDVLSTSNDAYRANMERIITESLDRNIIPVLTAIPPFHRAGYEGRPAELNDIQAALAQAYDIPFWNYWAAIQSLPNEGLGPDGIHPSSAFNSADFTAENLQYGNTVHNLTALQLLDILWRQAMY
ncbi:MAG: SH3 domain-containing protein [Anaerolineales bacterium]